MGHLGDEAFRLDEADQAEPVGADRDRELVEREVIWLAEGGGRRRRARDVRAVGDLEATHRRAGVGDQPEPVGADCDRCVELTRTAHQRRRRRRGARNVRAMGDPQLVPLVVRDQREPIRPDRDRAVRAPVVEPGALEPGTVSAETGRARGPLRPLWPLGALRALCSRGAALARGTLKPPRPDRPAEATRTARAADHLHGPLARRERARARACRHAEERYG